MSKSILIIDTPKCCADCPACAWSEITGLYNCLNGTKEEKCVDDYLLDDRLKKPTWCPLKPMPKKIEELSIEETIVSNKYTSTILLEKAIKKAKQRGYNECLDEILGGEE